VLRVKGSAFAPVVYNSPYFGLLNKNQVLRDRMESVCSCWIHQTNYHTCGWHAYTKLKDAREALVFSSTANCILKAQMEGITLRGRDATTLGETVPLAEEEPVVLVGRWLTLEKEEEK
jgi:hypothetical protein